MICKTLNIIFLGSLFLGGYAKAQSLQIDAIEILAFEQTGDDDFGTYNSFVSKARNPALFQFDLINQPEKIGIITNNGFAIDFVLSQKDEPVNEFIFGFQAGTVESELFNDLSLQRDTSLFVGTIKNSSQYFALKGGYQRVFRADKKIRIITGTSLQIGIPVSSKTMQTITSQFLQEEYNFFAKQSASLGFSINYGIRFTLFRNMHLALMGRPTFLFQNIDGTPSSSLIRGTNLSLQFKIRQ